MTLAISPRQRRALLVVGVLAASIVVAWAAYALVHAVNARGADERARRCLWWYSDAQGEPRPEWVTACAEASRIGALDDQGRIQVIPGPAPGP